MTAAILDDAGRFVRKAKTNEIGSILIHGPNVFRGYLDSRHNAGLWVEIEGAAWLNTGDLGRPDAEGYFWLTGRSKELIIRAGHNIDPRVIEEALLQHPNVQMAAAVARPDAHYGELPVAYVQLRAGTTVSEEALLEHARKHIGERAAWPKAIRFVDEMPQTAVGKLFKPALRRLEIRATLLQALCDEGLGDSRLEIVEHAESGVRVNVIAVNEQCKQKAEAVLARYPFAFTVTLGDAGPSSQNSKFVS